MIVTKSPAFISIVVSLTEAEAESLSHRLHVGRNRLLNAPASYKSGKVKPSAVTYGAEYGVTADDVAANSGGTLEALQKELSAMGYGPVKG
jgi:hypothetical protein